MSEELQLNSYVLVGNALHYLLSHPSPGLDANAEAVAALNAKLEPLRPNQILDGIATLAPNQRALLSRCCRYCMQVLEGDQASALLGLPPDVAEEVLQQLGLG